MTHDSASVHPRCHLSYSCLSTRMNARLVMLFPVSGPSTASAPSCLGDDCAEQGAIHFSGSCALRDCQCNAQAAQAAHARRFKPLKLKSSTNGRVEPDWSRLRKEDPVRFMALYKADYMYTIRRQLHAAVQDWHKMCAKTVSR